jgi:hypothetical protein
MQPGDPHSRQVTVLLPLPHPPAVDGACARRRSRRSAPVPHAAPTARIGRWVCAQPHRLEFAHGDSQSAFFGTYKEVTPYSRLVWTNEESDDGAVTTVTFEEQDGKTLLAMHELYPSKEALDAAGTGSADATVETFAQLDELLVTLGASAGRS